MVSIVELGIETAAAVFAHGFSDYFVKLEASPAALLGMARVDSVDFAASFVVRSGNAPVAIALIARRGWTSRLAGMAVVPDARRRGSGFTKLRRLVGFSRPAQPPAPGSSKAMEVDVRAVASAVTAHGLADLPWQLSGETLAQLTPPAKGYALDGAWAALGSLEAPEINLRALVTERSERGRGRAGALLRALLCEHSQKTWSLRSIWPEELSRVFFAAGFARAPLSQWQMARTIGG